MSVVWTADRTWHFAYDHAILGERVSPRGMETLELLHVTHKIDMMYPVVTMKERRLNYRFMAAEALWILKGQNELSELTPYNSKMADYSDNGIILAGAYGPNIADQWDYVVDVIKRDPMTRQATLTLWAPNPLPSKDIPCTVAMDFKLRNNRLHLSVFMRSSDVWLGLPYDMFSFACVGYKLITNLRQTYPKLQPGMLNITAASSHIYTKDLDIVLPSPPRAAHPTPEALWSSDTNYLLDYLSTLRDTKAGDPHRWWEK